MEFFLFLDKMAEIANPIELSTVEEPKEAVEKKEEEKTDEIDAAKVCDFNF